MSPVLSGDLNLLRSTPQASKLYLVIQNAERWQGSLYGEEFLWHAQIDGDPAGDPVAQLTVDNGGPAATLLDRMTVLIGSTPGAWDKGFFSVRTDQVVGPATVSLDIGQSSEITNVVSDGDYVTVLDEFRVLRRIPRITEAAGVLTWYKDWNVTFDSLGADADTRREASLPPVPIMGPHAVRFVPTDASVWVDFDGSDSYATYPGATVNAWDWSGERDSGAWASALENPLPVEYTQDDISGLAGYRVTLEVGSDVQDPDARFRRGVRYVFTLRRPGTRLATDPVNAEPLVNFEVGAISGNFEQGRWRTSVRVYGSDAAETVILPGALVILFAEDIYSGDTNYIGPSENGSVGPIRDRENIVLCGRVADGSIKEDSETGEITFDIVSVAQQATDTEQYPIAIENNDGATEWYECPDLTIFRAVWHYAIWHTTLPLVADFYPFNDDVTLPEVTAQDFLASDLYSAIDRFLWERRFGRLLYDRFERGACQVDLEMKAAHSGPTLLSIQTSDWLGEITLREANDPRVSLTELGGVVYDAGLIIPYLSNAPGIVSGEGGRPSGMRNMAILSQTELNTLSGRYHAKQNNRYPEILVQMAGNWRVGDIWPQEYVIFDSLVTQRKTFTDLWTILREPTFSYDKNAGAIFTQWNLAAETDGPPGVTVEIPEEMPDFTRPGIPRYPPGTPPTPTNPTPGDTDEGRRMVATDVGVFVTDNIGATNPVWYAANNGFVTADDLHVWDIKRDPFHWWTSGGTERTLWAVCKTGIWKHENFPYGTWVQQLTYADFRTAGFDNSQPALQTALWYARMDMSIEVEDRYAINAWNNSGGLGSYEYVCVMNAAAISNIFELYRTNDGNGYGDVKFAPHGAGNVLYAAGNRAPLHAGSSEGRVYKTLNAGVGWGVPIDTLNSNKTGIQASISIPYVDASNPDSYVLWGRGWIGAGSIGQYRITENAGATFADINDSDTNQSKIGTGGHPDYIVFLGADTDGNPCKWSNDRGVTYTDLPLLPINETTIAAFVRWSGGILQDVLVGTENAAPIEVYSWKQGQIAWTNRTGNLTAFGPATIYQIDRDSMGSA